MKIERIKVRPEVEKVSVKGWLNLIFKGMGIEELGQYPKKSCFTGSAQPPGYGRPSNITPLDLRGRTEPQN